MSATIWSPGSTSSPALPAVAPVSFVKGTTGTPGINFVGDTGTGVWSEGNGYLDFSVGGVTQLSIDPLGNVKFSGKLYTAAEIDVASSTTTDIGTPASNSVRITGTNTINSFGTVYRGPVFVRFAAALTLTNGASLILPGGTNISISAGDSCIAVPKATAGVSDGWAVIAIQKGAGGSGGSGSTGATGNYAFFENDQTITGSYTLSNGKNAMSAGPITVLDTVVVTIPTGATWSII